MTHEAGIEAAAETLVTEMYPDAPDMQGARHSARLIVEAYLDASGMTLEPTEQNRTIPKIHGETNSKIGAFVDEIVHEILKENIKSVTIPVSRIKSSG